MTNEMIVTIDGVEITDPEVKQTALFLSTGDNVQLETSKNLTVGRSYPRYTGDSGEKTEWLVKRLGGNRLKDSIESPIQNAKATGFWLQLNIDDLQPEIIEDNNYKLALLHTRTGSLFQHNGKTLLVVERVLGIEESGFFWVILCESIV